MPGLLLLLLLAMPNEFKLEANDDIDDDWEEDKMVCWLRADSPVSVGVDGSLNVFWTADWI